MTIDQSIIEIAGRELAKYQMYLGIEELRPVVAAILKQREKAQQEPVAVNPDWYTQDGDSWYEHPADVDLLYDLGLTEQPELGTEYEVDVCWTGKQTYRVVEAEGDDVDVELVSSSVSYYTAPAADTRLAEAIKAAKIEVLEDISKLITESDCEVDWVQFRICEIISELRNAK